jgi:hypothetical protein
MVAREPLSRYCLSATYTRAPADVFGERKKMENVLIPCRSDDVAPPLLMMMTRRIVPTPTGFLIYPENMYQNFIGAFGVRMVRVGRQRIGGCVRHLTRRATQK